MQMLVDGEETKTEGLKMSYIKYYSDIEKK